MAFYQNILCVSTSFLHVFWPRSAVCATRLVRICKFDWLVTSQPASVDRESMRRDTRKTRKKSSFKTGTFLNSTWCRKQAVTQVIDGATTTRQKCFLRLVRLQIFLLFCIFVRLPAFFVLFCFFSVFCFVSRDFDYLKFKLIITRTKRRTRDRHSKRYTKAQQTQRGQINN